MPETPASRYLSQVFPRGLQRSFRSFTNTRVPPYSMGVAEGLERRGQLWRASQPTVLTSANFHPALKGTHNDAL